MTCIVAFSPPPPPSHYHPPLHARTPRCAVERPLQSGRLAVSTGFALTVLCIAVVAVGSGVQQASLYGYVASFPPRYTQALMTGEGLAGLVVSVNRIVTKASVSNDKAGLTKSTYVFFALGVTLILSAALIFRRIYYSAFARGHLMRSHSLERTPSFREHGNGKAEDEAVLLPAEEPPHLSSTTTTAAASALAARSYDRESRRNGQPVVAEAVELGDAKVNGESGVGRENGNGDDSDGSLSRVDRGCLNDGRGSGRPISPSPSCCATSVACPRWWSLLCGLLWPRSRRRVFGLIYKIAISH